MDWYYAVDDQQQGPVSQEEFDSLVADGTISLSTLVWRQGMPDWQPFSEVGAARPATATAVAPGQERCIECGRAYPAEEMITYGNDYVCAECKPIFFERVRQGVPVAAVMRYAGFWIRLVAKIVDGIILTIARWIVQLLVLGMFSAGAGEMSEGTVIAAGVLISLINFAIGIGYYAGFIAKFAATPGKMACGLKIVRSDGSRVTFLRAVGRFFAEILSWLTLAIGYIIAAFDSEKRALHDRICDTRVVWAR